MQIQAEGLDVAEAARHQVLFREINEQLVRLTGALADTDYWLLICECGDTGCAESLEISAAEYEAVRAESGCFVVLPGHELAEVERVVRSNGRYLVVEKLGRAVKIGREGDPRS